MDVLTIIKIRTDPNIYRYLRENSYWYKYLNRDPLSIKKLEEEMKNKHKKFEVSEDLLEQVEDESNSEEIINKLKVDKEGRK